MSGQTYISAKLGADLETCLRWTKDRSAYRCVDGIDVFPKRPLDLCLQYDIHYERLGVCKDADKRRARNSFNAPENGVLYRIFKTNFGSLVVIAATVSGILFSRDAESAYLRVKRTRIFHAPRSCVDVQTMAFASANGLRSLVLDPVRRSAKSKLYRKFRLRD